MRYLVNAFSLNMLPEGFSGNIFVSPLSPNDIRSVLTEGSSLRQDIVPAIGHEDTAAIVAAVLGVEGSLFARVSVALKPGDTVFVAQYRGPRLPEGTRVLPEGAALGWAMVHVDVVS